MLVKPPLRCVCLLLQYLLQTKFSIEPADLPINRPHPRIVLTPGPSSALAQPKDIQVNSIGVNTSSLTYIHSQKFSGIVHLLCTAYI